ncbi:hypothetical protein BJV78DRAFT_84943 [Lactifluus subvellereus]|nr:hypothetical protein BJV78DRAFT_84943 [Lactifluus subvellereus]
MPTTGGPDKDLPSSPTRLGEPRSGSGARSGSVPSNAGNTRRSSDGGMTEPGSHVAAQQEAMRQVRPSPAGVVARRSLPGRHAEPEGATSLSAISAAAEPRRPSRTEGARPSPRRPPPVPATASGSLRSEARSTYTSELYAEPDALHQDAQPPAGAGDQRRHRAPRISVSKSSSTAPRAAQRHGVGNPRSIRRSKTSPLSQQHPPAIPVAPQDSVVTLSRTELPCKPPAVPLPPLNHVARVPSHNDRTVHGANTGARLPPTPLEMQVKKARDTLDSSGDRREQKKYSRGSPSTQGRSPEPTPPPPEPTEEHSVSPNDVLPLAPYPFAVGQNQGDLVVERGPSLSMDISRERSPTAVENAAPMPGHAVPSHQLIPSSRSKSLRQSSAQAPSSDTTPPGIPSRAEPRRSESTRSNGQAVGQAGEGEQPGGGISRMGPPIAGKPDAPINTQPARTEPIHLLVPSPGQPKLSGQPGDGGGPGDNGQPGGGKQSGNGGQSPDTCCCCRFEPGHYRFCW